MKTILFAVLLLSGIFAYAGISKITTDEAAVKAAVLDYVEGIYEVAPERIERSVDVTLRKYGYGRRPENQEYFPGSEMNFKQLRSLAANWNKEGRVDAATAAKEIVVLDMMDKTASAKLTASWGIDYFHLAKEDGQWRIVNVLWQSHPPEMSVE